ncbi:hypothetical protein V8G54_017421 [Vigna mungo]|uniref:UBA domain-containing protein n=1 Tax=Vigna mungo TaxID=3915 RepID=A0AAQ3NPV9_VIGMU
MRSLPLESEHTDLGFETLKQIEGIVNEGDCGFSVVVGGIGSFHATIVLEPGQTGGGTGMQENSVFSLFLFSSRNYALVVGFLDFFVAVVFSLYLFFANYLRAPCVYRVAKGELLGPLNNMGLEMLSSMFGGLGAGSLAVPNRSNEPPEQLYATQLSQLQEMGFFDTQENIRALIATSGNVHAAVERLLGNSGQ